MDRESSLDRRLAARVQAVSLRQLHFVVALADCASFSRAAKQIGVSQPGLSAAIRQIESLLELRLFDRDTHRVALTTAGLALLPHVRRLLITADNAFVDMVDATVSQRTTVRVGAIPSSVPGVAKAIAELAGPADGINVYLSDGKSDTLIEQLQVGAFDIVICVQALAEPGLEAALLTEDEMLLLVRTDHPLAAVKQLAWRDLSRSEVVHFSGGSIGELASAAMRQNHLVSTTRYKVDQVDSLFGLVRAGLAVGVMPRLYTLGSDDRDIVRIPLVEPSIRRRVVLLRRRGLRREHPAGAAFADKLAERLSAILGPSRKAGSASGEGR